MVVFSLLANVDKVDNFVDKYGKCKILGKICIFTVKYSKYGGEKHMFSCGQH